MTEMMLEGLEAAAELSRVDDLYALGQEGVFEGNEYYWGKVEFNERMKELYSALGIDVSVDRTIVTELDNYNPENHEKTDNVY